jgi:hypothetical protein
LNDDASNAIVAYEGGVGGASGATSSQSAVIIVDEVPPFDITDNPSID